MQQQQTYKEILFQILEIIGYQNNKEKFVTEFEILNRLDAAASIIDKYPVDIQKKIKACQKVYELSQYISEDEYKEAYIHISQKALQEFLASVAGTLSRDQKQKIVKLASFY